ncbi:MAG TPA: histidine kinase [Chitinophagaceae bacterium]|nr:histidine kinase [Chitinophagaceae bacterium]
MNGYDLIFSTEKRYRIRRHLLFWIAWCIYYIVSFLIPTHWIPAWNLRGPMTHIERYGIVLASVRILLAAVLITLVHAALVYGILYFILPRYLSKNKNLIITTGLMLLFVCFIAFINYFNFVLSFYVSTRKGYFATMPTMEFIVPVWIRHILINYPTVVGFALAIKLLKNWYVKQEETVQLTREKINAELQLLKAQVHPHFLFNTLNNIYSFILNGSSRAPEMIKKLSALLNYILHECDRPLVPLSKELSLIQDYMELERIRYGDKLSMNLHIQGTAAGKMISPLLLIPFVENSFKHGTSRMLTHPWVKLDVLIDTHSLEFRISNNKPEQKKEAIPKKGIGLNNVKKRLQLLYPGTHSLSIIENEMSYDVTMKIALHVPAENGKEVLSLEEKESYEFA